MTSLNNKAEDGDGTTSFTEDAAEQSTSTIDTDTASESSPTHPVNNLTRQIETETETESTVSSFTDSEVKSQLGEPSNAMTSTIRLPAINPEPIQSPRVDDEWVIIVF